MVEINAFMPELKVAENIKILEKVADKYCENKMTEPSAKNIFFQACLLHLANDDTIAARMALQNYSDKSTSFNGSR